MSTCSLNAQAGCDVCNKSSLSLLLVRPSPVATNSDLYPLGSDSATADSALVTRIIPAGLTESRPVLRLLRAGYVHLFIPKTNQWRTWRVTEDTDIIEESNEHFSKPSANTE